MFNFLKAPCGDMDLYGYFATAVGGVVSLARQKGSSFDEEDLLKRVDLFLQQRKKKIDVRQQLLVKFAAELVVQHCFYVGDKNNQINQCCQRLGSLVDDANFNYQDPAIEGLRDEMGRFGCIFKY